MVVTEYTDERERKVPRAIKMYNLRNIILQIFKEHYLRDMAGSGILLFYLLINVTAVRSFVYSFVTVHGAITTARVPN